jgi:hypothetical protein
VFSFGTAGDVPLTGNWSGTTSAATMSAQSLLAPARARAMQMTTAGQPEMLPQERLDMANEFNQAANQPGVQQELQRVQTEMHLVQEQMQKR